MIRQLLAAYRRSRLPRTISRHARLESVALESRLAPTGADLLPLPITTPAIVTVAPQPSNVAPANTQTASIVRTDLFGHAIPTREETEVETGEVWNDPIDW